MSTLTGFQWFFVALAVLGAGVVRGASGFGFSMIMIVLLTLLVSPAQAAPVIVLWEILASVVHLPFVWRQVDWRALRWLAVGVALGTPLGVSLLVGLPPEPMTVGINATVMLLTAFLLKGRAPKRTPNALETTAVGMLSGVINGASGNGGPPIILLFLSSPAGAAVGRASLIAFFLFTDLWASLFFVRQGLMDWSSLRAAVVLLPVLALGIWLGSRIFAHIDEDRFKRLVLILLLGIAAVGLIRAVWPSQ